MQKRTTMCNYLKNMAGYKHNQLRHKSFDNIQKLFDKALKRVNTFVPMDTKKVEGSKAKTADSKTRVKESSNRSGEDLDRESTKKQKVEDETEQITRDARKIYYHITIADGSDGMWREQGRYLIKSWKLIDSCGVHCLMLESMYIYMLVEKEYPLAQFTYRRMWEGKIQVDYEYEMAFELLRFIKKQVKKLGDVLLKK
ncbi:hypothetical protein Tco_0484186 [Tanacetum coccineum]